MGRLPPSAARPREQNIRLALLVAAPVGAFDLVERNEAVDIAKKFSTQDSGKFVNGILDKVKSELMRPAREVKS